MPEQQSEEDIPSYIPDILPKNNSIAQQTDKSQLSLSYREGPITPDELREYNELVPGFAQDYLNEVIREVQHHRDIERERIEIEKGELAQASIYLGIDRWHNHRTYCHWLCNFSGLKWT
jgi:hypothetical protein